MCARETSSLPPPPFSKVRMPTLLLVSAGAVSKPHCFETLLEGHLRARPRRALLLAAGLPVSWAPKSIAPTSVLLLCSPLSLVPLPSLYSLSARPCARGIRLASSLSPSSSPIDRARLCDTARRPRDPAPTASLLAALTVRTRCFYTAYSRSSPHFPLTALTAGPALLHSSISSIPAASLCLLSALYSKKTFPSYTISPPLPLPLFPHYSQTTHTLSTQLYSGRLRSRCARLR